MFMEIRLIRFQTVILRHFHIFQWTSLMPFFCFKIVTLVGKEEREHIMYSFIYGMALLISMIRLPRITIHIRVFKFSLGKNEYVLGYRCVMFINLLLTLYFSFLFSLTVRLIVWFRLIFAIICLACSSKWLQSLEFFTGAGGAWAQGNLRTCLLGLMGHLGTFILCLMGNQRTQCFMLTFF